MAEMYNKEKKKKKAKLEEISWMDQQAWDIQECTGKKKLSKQVAIKALLRKIRAGGEPGATKRVKMEDHRICIHFLIFVHTASPRYLFLPLSSE